LVVSFWTTATSLSNSIAGVFPLIIGKLGYLFWIEVAIILFYVILILLGSRKLGTFFSIQFFIPGIIWAMGRGFFYYHWKYEKFAGYFSKYTMFSPFFYLVIIVLWYISLRIARKFSKNVVYDKPWKGSFLLFFWLSAILLQLGLMVLALKFNLVKNTVQGGYKFKSLWNWLQVFLISLEGLTFIWVVRTARLHSNLRNQGLVYATFLTILFQPLVWFSGFLALGTVNRIFRILW
jgi:hypothetical protein